tara:strand:+ start:891 stop:1796 length:906 start_codon:yes stop_codon:yes gene_type:complete
MKVLIIGASGFIGYYVGRRLIGESEIEVVSTYNSRIPDDVDKSWLPLDITDHDCVEEIFQNVRPDVVLLLAAIADVKTAETGQERTTEVNVGGTRQVAQLCSQQGTKLIFLSSEYVFGGDNGPYHEDDSPDPITHYGTTKSQAEKAVADHVSQWSIVRTSLVYGWPLRGRRNTVTSIADRLRSGQTYIGDSHAYRTPIYVEHLIEGITELVVNDHTGIFHIAGANLMNMYEFGRVVAEAFRLDGRLVQPADIQCRVPHPTNLSRQTPPLDILGLDCRQTNSQLGLRTFDITTGLREMLHKG